MFFLKTPLFSMFLIAVFGFHIVSNTIKDDQNRIRIFRGFNIGAKDKVPSFNSIDPAVLLSKLWDTNSNVVRFPFIWEAYESTLGNYNQSYLDYYSNVVDILGVHNISVILDFHQDGYSRYSLDGCGEGFPKWATSNAETPDNGINCKNWGFKMLYHKQMRYNFNNFFTSPQLQYAFIRMVTTVILKLNHSYILGMDILNEPIVDESLLSKFHALVQKHIRPLYKGIIFQSPNPLSTTPGFGQTKLQQIPNDDQIVYAPHYYKPLGMHSIFVHQFFKFSQTTSDKWHKPWFLNEFGMPPGKDAKNELSLTYDLMDKYLISGCQWTLNTAWDPEIKDGWNFEDFSVFGKDWRNNYIVRPYVRAISGRSASFEYKSMHVRMVYDAVVGISEIAVPRLLIIKSVSPHCNVVNSVIYCEEVIDKEKQVIEIELENK